MQLVISVLCPPQLPHHGQVSMPCHVAVQVVVMEHDVGIHGSFRKDGGSIGEVGKAAPLRVISITGRSEARSKADGWLDTDHRRRDSRAD